MASGDPLVMKRTLKREWFIGSTAAAVALGALGVGRGLGKLTHSSVHEKVISWTCALALLLAGAYAVRHLALAFGRTLARRAGLGAGATLRLVLSGTGYLILIFALLGVLDVSLSHLLIGAGLAGIVLGIAAQQSLGNIFAAIVLLFARPFVVGDDIQIRSGAIGTINVKVLGIGMTYVTVRSDDGILKIPNSAMLASGIGQPSASQVKLLDESEASDSDG